MPLSTLNLLADAGTLTSPTQWIVATLTAVVVLGVAVAPHGRTVPIHP